MKRVLVSGISGAGKTTVGNSVARALGLPRYELDALHHGPGWTKRPTFEDDVERFSTTGAWVTEDQYVRRLGERLWQRADTLVWLDLPRATVMRQVFWRSLRRAVLREVDLLVIDEVSMLRADLLDAVDQRMRSAKGSARSFGGAQLLLIGDLFQLPPVVKDSEREVMRRWYPSMHFFSSRA